MQAKTTLAAILALPLLLMACDRADQSPTAANPSQEKQAMTPDQMLERSPPAAGPSTPSDSTTGLTPPQSGSPATQPQDESKRTN